MSHPSRGEWIEIYGDIGLTYGGVRLTPHGVSGLKWLLIIFVGVIRWSHPSRGEWIEIEVTAAGQDVGEAVSPLTG